MLTCSHEELRVIDLEGLFPNDFSGSLNILKIGFVALSIVIMDPESCYVYLAGEISIFYIALMPCFLLLSKWELLGK